MHRKGESKERWIIQETAPGLENPRNFSLFVVIESMNAVMTAEMDGARTTASHVSNAKSMNTEVKCNAPRVSRVLEDAVMSANTV